MGYVINELAQLPVDDNIHFYIFVVNGRYRDPRYDTIRSNFIELAHRIGRNAAIAISEDSENFTTSVARKYLGEGNSDRSFVEMLPALLITNDHPDKLRRESMRLIIPLRDAENRYGNNWYTFFNELTDFVQGRSDDFLHRFEEKENFFDIANRVIELRPGLFGFGININELIHHWRRRRA